MNYFILRSIWSEHLVSVRRFETYIKFFDGSYRKMTWEIQIRWEPDAICWAFYGSRIFFQDGGQNYKFS